MVSGERQDLLLAIQCHPRGAVERTSGDVEWLAQLGVDDAGGVPSLVLFREISEVEHADRILGSGGAPANGSCATGGKARPQSSMPPHDPGDRVLQRSFVNSSRATSD